MTNDIERSYVVQKLRKCRLEHREREYQRTVDVLKSFGYDEIKINGDDIRKFRISVRVDNLTLREAMTGLCLVLQGYRDVIAECEYILGPVMLTHEILRLQRKIEAHDQDFFKYRRRVAETSQ